MLLPEYLRRLTQDLLDLEQAFEQWKEGKIDLAVPGCDPPRMMSDDELINETATVADLHQMLDNMLE